MMAVDWLIRHCTPAWLRLAGLGTHADKLAGLPEITDSGQCLALIPTLAAVGRDAYTARAAAWAAARAGTRAATLDAARAAAWNAARVAARKAALAVAWDAARDAAGAAALAAAGDAATHVLAPTVADLQQSALALVNRMIDAR
jgi:hypothetical protein